MTKQQDFLDKITEGIGPEYTLVAFFTAMMFAVDHIKKVLSEEEYKKIIQDPLIKIWVNRIEEFKAIRNEILDNNGLNKKATDL